MDANKTEKSKTLYILDTLDLQPFAITDSHGHERNALAHKKVICDLVGSHDSIRSILPLKRRYMDTSLCVNCSPIVATGLENLFAVSPYTDILRQRAFVELTPDICALLNKDWEFFPQIKYATAKLFSGCILQNTINGHSVLVNTVEVYGRTKNVDIHRESFGKVKDSMRGNGLLVNVITTCLAGTQLASCGNSIV